MKKLKSRGIKTLKTFHLLFVMMWVIGVFAMGIIPFTNPRSGDELYTMFHIMRIIDDALVIPGAILTVITGVIYGLFTNWGFFKHKWITVKWIVSITIIIIGTFYFSPMLDECLEIANSSRDSALNNQTILAQSQITTMGAYIQGSMLAILVVISTFKPWKKKKDANE